MRVLAASAAAMLLALFASEAMRDDAGMSFASELLVPSAAAQSSRVNPAQTQLAMVGTAREEIPNAYLSALQRSPVVAPPAATSADLPDTDVPSAATRRIASDELALLMKRAMSLLASGDILPARLLLERIADAQEASAAFLLAQTYDPAVLGTSDIRTITPDRTAALAWYRKAAELGSVDAQRRLPQILK